jgi:electron transfer flavoprotein alpha/beta subunit
MLTALADVLAAGRGDDEVSAQLAETLGWDQLELVEQVMGERQKVLDGLRRVSGTRRC